MAGHPPADDQTSSACRRLVLATGLGAVWYAHDWWKVGRCIESMDEAYVGGDITVIAPDSMPSKASSPSSQADA